MGRLIYADDVISLLANHHFDDSKENILHDSLDRIFFIIRE